MGKPLQELIAECLSAARSENSTRENSLCITKLQEALMWHNEHQKSLIAAARKAGVGFTHDVHNQSTFVTTEPTSTTTENPVT